MKDLDFIYKRKSVRKFKDEEVPKEDIVELLKAATYAPSPKHQQNWHFIVLQNKEMIDEMAKIVRYSHERIGSIAKTEKDQKIHMSVIDYYTAFKNAPVVVLVYGCEYKMIEYKILKENNASQEVLDILKSPQSGAQAIGAAVEIEKLIGFDKPGYELMSMIALGVGEENTPKQPPRKPLEEVVTFID